VGAKCFTPLLPATPLRRASAVGIARDLRQCAQRASAARRQRGAARRRAIMTWTTSAAYGDMTLAAAAWGVLNHHRAGVSVISGREDVVRRHGGDMAAWRGRRGASRRAGGRRKAWHL